MQTASKYTFTCLTPPLRRVSLWAHDRGCRRSASVGCRRHDGAGELPIGHIEREGGSGVHRRLDLRDRREVRHSCLTGEQHQHGLPEDVEVSPGPDTGDVVVAHDAPAGAVYATVESDSRVSDPRSVVGAVVRRPVPALQSARVDAHAGRVDRYVQRRRVVRVGMDMEAVGRLQVDDRTVGAVVGGLDSSPAA